MKLLIICASPAPVGSILAAASEAEATCVVAGSEDLARSCAAGSPDHVAWIDTAGRPTELYAGAVARLAETAAPDLIICQDAPQDRVLAAAAAAAVGATWTPSLTHVSSTDGGMLVEGPALEGRILETVLVPAPAAAIYTGRDEGITGDPAPIEPVDAVAEGGITIVEPATGPDDAGITAASRVIGIGRGVTSKEMLPEVDRLARALGAEVGCTLPVSEDLHWFGPDHLIGRSGYAVGADLYLSLGVSGQPQHLDGIRDVRIVAAVNSDPDAPIFRRAKYGVVADIADVLPALITSAENKDPHV